MKELTSFLNGLGVLQQIETYDIKDEFLSQSDCVYSEKNSSEIREAPPE